MEFVKEHGSITRQKTEELIHSGTTKAFKILKSLCLEGKLQSEGSGKQVKYINM